VLWHDGHSLQLLGVDLLVAYLAYYAFGKIQPEERSCFMPQPEGLDPSSPRSQSGRETIRSLLCQVRRKKLSTADRTGQQDKQKANARKQITVVLFISTLLPWIDGSLCSRSLRRNIVNHCSVSTRTPFLRPVTDLSIITSPCFTSELEAW